MLTSHFRWLVGIVFAIIATEAALLLRWPAGLVALVVGFVGSLALLIPPLRVESLKFARSNLAAASTPRSKELRQFKQGLVEYFETQIDRWEAWDSIWLIAGAILLGSYFLLQGISKSTTVDRAQLSEAVNNVRTDLSINSELDQLGRDVRDMISVHNNN